ncbi:hypothetical protein M3J09_011629 [Ascochyta lentis]
MIDRAHIRHIKTSEVKDTTYAMDGQFILHAKRLVQGRPLALSVDVIWLHTSSSIRTIGQLLCGGRRVLNAKSRLDIDLYRYAYGLTKQQK